MKSEGPEWKPAWASIIGCIEGCLRHEGSDITRPWLYGGTGHAFLLNASERPCPSDPTCWDMIVMHRLGENVGYELDGVVSSPDEEDFAHKQKQAWDMAKEAIDAGHACYGWGLRIPEYYVINGYKDDEYLFTGPLTEGETDSLPWQDFGKTIFLELSIVKRTEPAGDRKTVHDALAYAIELADEPDRHGMGPRVTGLAAYDRWMHLLSAEDGFWSDLFNDFKAEDMGHAAAYNTAVWSECRTNAAAFLKEAGERLSGVCDDLFGEAINHYESITADFTSIEDAFPFLPADQEQWAANIRSRENRQAVLKLLQSARETEEKGIVSLREIVDVLKD